MLIARRGEEPGELIQLPRDPQMLSGFASQVVQVAAGFVLPAPLVEGTSFDLAAAAQPIDKLRLSLDGYLADVARELREGQQTLAEKNKAIAEYDATFTAVATLLSGLYRLAGEAELADKIRPSTRRPGQIEAELPTQEGTPPPIPKLPAHTPHARVY
jgi:hypothetical protein